VLLFSTRLTAGHHGGNPAADEKWGVNTHAFTVAERFPRAVTDVSQLRYGSFLTISALPPIRSR
jgi:hypothetical protein